MRIATRTRWKCSSRASAGSLAPRRSKRSAALATAWAIHREYLLAMARSARCRAVDRWPLHRVRPGADGDDAATRASADRRAWLLPAHQCGVGDGDPLPGGWSVAGPPRANPRQPAAEQA